MIEHPLETAQIERRRHTRQLVTKPCKVRDGRTARFIVGETTDVSEGGALIRLCRTRPLSVGDELHVVVTATSRVVIRERDMIRGRIRRVLQMEDNTQAVAVEFVREHVGHMPEPLAVAA